MTERTPVRDDPGWGGCLGLLAVVAMMVLFIVFAPGVASRAMFHFDAGTACATHGGVVKTDTARRLVWCRDADAHFTIARR
jgi:hypothetical protein